MLSLLSLLLASGTVLRADTELWTSSTYPDPRTNSTTCNTWPNSTLCDPDHILTDQWRLNINENINRQRERLREANILYVDDAPEECRMQNTTDGVQIYVILAKRIHTASNHSITDTDLINFGNELAEQYGLNAQPCRNFLILIGVEAARLAYFRTGVDLKLPHDVTERVFNQYTTLFNEKNYMEGLNRIIDEIGELMIDPFQETTTEKTTIVQATSTVMSTTTSTVDVTTTPIIVPIVIAESHGETRRQALPWWMLTLMISAILLALTALILLVIARRQHCRRPIGQMQTVTALKPDHVHDSALMSADELIKTNNNNTIVTIKDRDLESGTNSVCEQGREQDPASVNAFAKREENHVGGECNVVSQVETTSLAPSEAEEDGEGTVDRTGTPPLVARRLLQLDSHCLSTDRVARKNLLETTDHSPSHNPPNAIINPPIRTARRVDEHDLTF